MGPQEAKQDTRYTKIGYRIQEKELYSHSEAVTKVFDTIPGYKESIRNIKVGQYIEAWQRPSLPWKLECEAKGLTREKAMMVIDAVKTIPLGANAIKGSTVVALVFGIFGFGFSSAYFLYRGKKQFAISMMLSFICNTIAASSLTFPMINYWQLTNFIDANISQVDTSGKHNWMNGCTDELSQIDFPQIEFFVSLITPNFLMAMYCLIFIALALTFT